jgi:hypothetical protein
MNEIGPAVIGRKSELAVLPDPCCASSTPLQRTDASLVVDLAFQSNDSSTSAARVLATCRPRYTSVVILGLACPSWSARWTALLPRRPRRRACAPAVRRRPGGDRGSSRSAWGSTRRRAARGPGPARVSGLPHPLRTLPTCPEADPTRGQAPIGTAASVKDPRSRGAIECGSKPGASRPGRGLRRAPR